MAKNGYNFNLDFIIYVLLACLHYSGSNLQLLHSRDNDSTIREAWGKLEDKTLDYVASIMQSHAYVDHTDEINTPYALIPIITFCFKVDRPLTEIEIKKMAKWFYYSQIWSRYSFQVQTKMDYDLRLVKESEQPFDDLLQVIRDERPLKIEANQFLGRTVSHPLFTMVRWLFKSQEATCLTTGVKLS